MDQVQATQVQYAPAKHQRERELVAELKNEIGKVIIG